MKTSSSKQLHQIYEYFHWIYGLCREGVFDSEMVLRMFYVLANAGGSLRSLIKKFIFLMHGAIKNKIDIDPLVTVVDAIFDEIPVNISLGEPSRIGSMQALEYSEPARFYSLTFKSIAEQSARLEFLMRKLNMNLEKDAYLQITDFPKTSSLAEGFIVIPKYKIIAPQYHVAFARIIKVLTDIIPDFRIDIDNFDLQGLKCSDDAAQALNYFDKRYENGFFFLLPVQLGLLHNGESANFAISKYDNRGKYPEFGLDVISGAIAILSHDERILGETPEMTCPGVLYRPQANGRHDKVLQFTYHGGELILRAVSVQYHSENSAVATGFYSK